MNEAPRTHGATEVTSVCPYCAVGCSQKVYVKGGKIIDMEGSYDGPIDEGTLCPTRGTDGMVAEPANVFARDHRCGKEGVNMNKPYNAEVEGLQ